MTQLQPVGFIGLGAMGGAIASRLGDVGVSLHVFDPDKSRIEALRSLGVVAHASARAVADAAEIVFVSLPTPAISLEVALGKDGVVHGKAVKVYVEMSTIGKQAVTGISRGLALYGIETVDCPISGGPKGAHEGTLAVMIAGTPAAVARVKPYIALLSPNLFDISEMPGHAQTMKLVNNLISGANMAGAFEGLVLGAKAGLDPDTMVQVLNAGTGRNSATDSKVPRAILPGTFDYGARLAIMAKDIELGVAEAHAEGVPILTLSAVNRLFQRGMEQRGGEEDYTALIKVIEKEAGVEVRSRK